jgi:hypothetical protein
MTDFERRMQQMASRRGQMVKPHPDRPGRYQLINPRTREILAGHGDGMTDAELCGVLAGTRSPIG